MENDSLDPHSKQTEQKKLFVPELTTGKLAFLVSIAFFLVFSGPLMIFAPVPLAMTFLLYGRTKALVANGVMLGTSVAFAFVNPQYATIALSYLMVLSVSYLVTRIVWRNHNPVVGVVKNGSIILGVLFSFIGFFLVTKFELIKGTMIDVVRRQFTLVYESISKVAGVQGELLRNVQDIMEKPELIVDRILMYGAGSIIVAVFLILWVSMFIVLRNSLIWRPFQSYKFTSREMSQFRMPFETVWPLMTALALCVSHAYEVTGVWANIIGVNTLFALGVFYFFQGLGLLTETLIYWKIAGFLRMIFTLFIVMTSYEMVALAGVLDTWIDFRRFLNNKNKNEGDIL